MHESLHYNIITSRIYIKKTLTVDEIMVMSTFYELFSVGPSVCTENFVSMERKKNLHTSGKSQAGAVKIIFTATSDNCYGCSINVKDISSVLNYNR